jgi:hypothetical protein
MDTILASGQQFARDLDLCLEVNPHGELLVRKTYRQRETPKEFACA